MKLDVTPKQRSILIWMCVFIGVNQLGFGALIPVLPLYAQAYGVPASAIGTTIAVFGLSRMLSGMPAGQVADTLGRRPSMAVGGLICTAGNLWCAFAGSFPEFVAARFVAGLGAGWVQSTGMIVLADISTPAQRGRLMSIFMGTFLFTVGIGPLPGGLLAQHFGLAAPFAVYAIASAGAGLLAWWLVPETRDFAHADRPAPSPAEKPRAAPIHRQIRRLLADTGYRMVCLVGLVNAVVRTGGLFNIVPLLAASKLGLGPGAIGGWLALGSVLGLAASYPAGALADRFGRKPIIVPSAFLTAGAFLVYCWAPSTVWFAIACVLWGVAAAVNGAAPAAYAADQAPPGMNAAAISGYRTISDVGYVVGPVMLGLLVDWQGAEASLLAAAALVGGIGLLFWRYAPENWQGAARR
ncbi:MFS transporter [Quisquiliibacterium transsilvanicum]|uniref:MFS family permease n=1 Tax=Quisquiliibacterium transsilvanicum TaxID=1549638 RepID=A0A7W8HKH4_9BURK|nr:MFS transporter [Quisquiliibacterium transsilvanicum]MBB5273759.1 MFS family permease [Quisquiliibacterium transsilvanicum]